jgi:hypothetical protein
VSVLAATGGAIIAAPLVMALVPYFSAHRSNWLRVLVYTLVSRLWVMVVLPGLWLGVARLIRDIRPWRTAVASACVGELCYLMLDWLGGALGTLADPRVLLPRLFTLAAGVYLSARAIERGSRAFKAPGAEGVPPP